MVKTNFGTSLLGQSVKAAQSPEEAILERVPNPHEDVNYLARFTAPEFTSLCPVTGQPDFAILVIDYVPDKWLVELKSLKLFLTSFRNHGAFHEDCTLRIGKDLVGLLEPRWLRIGGYWYPRGASPSTCFGRPARRRRGSGCRIRASRPTARGGEPTLAGVAAAIP